MRSWWLEATAPHGPRLSPFSQASQAGSNPSPGLAPLQRAKMAQSFDITEPLTKRLRGLLKEYPPGTTVLRELLQNADDAGSRTVVPPPQKPSPPPLRLSPGHSNCGQCYTVDTNSYACTSLVDPALAAFQGPSLLVYNDALFTERDFDSLRKLGDSNKLQERIATGKFGLGFSSVCFPGPLRMWRRGDETLLRCGKMTDGQSLGLWMDRFSADIDGEHVPGF